MLMARNKNVHIMVDVIQLQKKKITPGKALTKISKPKKSRANDGISWAE